MADRIFRIVLIIANVICLYISDSDDKIVKIFSVLAIVLMSISLFWS